MGLAVASGVGGAALGGQSASAKAKAANEQLAQSIAKQNAFYDKNKNDFSGAVNQYSPSAAPQALSDAQDARSNSATGNISAPLDPSTVANAGDAPAAVKGEIAKRMLATHDFAMTNAKNAGKLGGYGDMWFKTQLGNQAASRNIGLTNSMSEEEKALLSSKQQLAMAQVGNSPWGPLLTGVSSILGSASGAGKGIGSLFRSAPTAAPVNGAASAFDDSGSVFGPMGGSPF